MVFFNLLVHRTPLAIKDGLYFKSCHPALQPAKASIFGEPADVSIS